MPKRVCTDCVFLPVAQRIIRPIEARPVCKRVTRVHVCTCVVSHQCSADIVFQMSDGADGRGKQSEAEGRIRFAQMGSHGGAQRLRAKHFLEVHTWKLLGSHFGCTKR